MVQKGCEVYLALVSDSTPAMLFVSGIRIIRDFLNVFLDELPGVAPTREVKFDIDLLLGTALVSITPYRMVPKELAELKA